MAALMPLVRIRAPVRPTEDPEKVRAAATAFFPDATAELGPDVVVATASDLRPLRKRVWELRIIDAVRGQLLRGVADDLSSVSFRLSKQAALAARVSFPPTPHGLGDLEVHIGVQPGDPWPDAERLVWWIAPETKDGEVVGPVDA